ncbi:MAG: diadenylate cyclase CdaA [Oscillospiraceae bacterium]|nr:diadenylate cyclase CdaA [Oscillospiraceae bacterium]MBQ8883070.1 diadenylate cyclase CdaA [Oscillospiraceae bacterium]
MDYIREAFSALISVFMSISLPDIIDMAILSYLIYHGIKLIRETRATQLIKGIVIICVAYMLSSFFDLKVITFLLKNVFQWGIIAIIILFQPELRRILDKMGRTKMVDFTSIFNSNDNDETDTDWNKAIEIIVDAAGELSSTATGALIVCERQTRLGEQIDTGTILNCTPSVEVLGNIFFPNTPLHDGAVIMRNGRILAAGCFLPKPQKEELINKQLGSRHRAAIGMSENSDAIVVVVSEETGTISVAEDGELTRGFNKDSLRRLLKQRLVQSDTNAEGGKNSLKERVKQKWKKEK